MMFFLRTECVKSLVAVLFRTEHSVVNAGCLSSAICLNLSCPRTVLAISQVRLSRFRKSCLFLEWIISSVLGRARRGQ